jgi:P-type Ca2+ transporter type 2C
MNQWYQLKPDDVLAELGTNAVRGLSGPEAAVRLNRYGLNELVDRGQKSPWAILWEQLTALMVIILIVAAIASAALGDWKDAIAILTIVVLNAILGFSQEYRAEKAMAALKRMSTPLVRVRRDGQVREISSRELTPGDVVLLEAGNVVPADLRLFESVNLRIQEAALTGESEPVEKDTLALGDQEAAIGDRHNMAFLGTIVTYGRGQGVVVDTGMKTELGAIAAMIQTVESESTPLQKRMDQLGRGLAVAALALVALIFVQGVIRGGFGIDNLKLMFLTAVSMAVAAVPEGLPAVVTIALALGAQRMLKRNALIRKLPAVETLGSVTVICSDKTGTLTENKMTVTALDVAGHRLDLIEHLRKSEPAMDCGDEKLDVLKLKPALPLLLAGGALCNDATLKARPGVSSGYQTIGDPTEGALLIAAARMGVLKPDLDALFPRVAEVPFESERKRMSTIHRCPAPGALLPEFFRPLGRASYVCFTKGSVDGLLDISREVWTEGRREPLGEDWRKRIVAANEKMAQNGVRVLGVAFRELNEAPKSPDSRDIERDLVFVGLVGMMDPPRAEVKAAVATCKAAGIRPVMITGDHPLTARHIARELGIAEESDRVLTGLELEKMSVEQLEKIVERVPVFARVSPEHKLKIVQALQDRGHVVAMTGDGVNDAPALKKADIGVAMGIAGTDVSKEAADMVLRDDNFTTIVSAVEEGRVIYDNIRKFIKYLLSCNSGELWVMLLAPFLGMPLPLSPLQILWMNLVTDGLPALALGLEPSERNTMQRPPYSPSENVFSRGLGWFVIWAGALMAAISLIMGYTVWHAGDTHFQTMVFTTMVLSQMAQVLALRSDRDSLWRIGLFSNQAMVGAVALTFILQILVIYAPVFQRIFNTAPLKPWELILTLVLSTTTFWVIELQKMWKRRQSPTSSAGSAP